MLLQSATQLAEASEDIQRLLRSGIIHEIVSHIPEDWLAEESNSLTADEMRAAYAEFLNKRLSKIDLLAKEASDAR